MVSENDKFVQGFDHISDENSAILILGTLPPCNREFYYQQDKTFWKILGQVFNCDFSTNTEKKLKDCRIALWDIFKSGCRKNGSSKDEDIILDTVQRNNISRFIMKHSSVKYIIINGKNYAYERFLEFNPEENIQRLITAGNVKKLYNTGSLNRLKKDLSVQAENEWIETLKACLGINESEKKKIFVVKKAKVNK